MTLSTEATERLEGVERRLRAACARAGRSRDVVTLIGASKVHDADRLRRTWTAGLRVFGENRVQEALAKAPELPDEIDWHLIGPLQSNKARRAVELFSTIHSLDRPKIVHAVERVARELGLARQGFLEVNLADEPTKHGFAPAEVVAALSDLSHLESLAIIGLMAIPAQGATAEDSRPWFIALRELSERVEAAGPPPGWQGALSMGMSRDFEIAIEEGATHVRVGTDLFGPRPPR